MSSKSNETPVKIIKKKSRGHGGHHGGAWKVAYADFVTAMMSLFIVLWIVSMNDKVKSNVAAYFEDPVKFSKEHSGNNPKPTDAHDVNPSSSSPTPAPSSDPARALQQEIERLKAEAMLLEDLISKDSDFKRFKDQIKIVVTEEGMRIELQEKSNDEEMFFDLSSAALKPDATKLLTVLSREIGKMKNPVIIEGHTDSTLYKNASYSNWNLSTDRANSARRILETSLQQKQLMEVRGYADRNLRNPGNPYDHANRRISILLKPIVNRPANGKGDGKPPKNTATPAPEGGHAAPSPEGAHGAPPPGSGQASPPSEEGHGAPAAPHH